MLLQESRDDIGAEGERDTTVVLAPAGDILIGIRPEEVAEQTAVRDLYLSARAPALPRHTEGWQVKYEMRTYIGGAHDTADLLHGVQIGAQTTVHGEDLLVNDGCDGEAVEAVSEGLPELDVVASLALVVEAIDAVDGGALVVAAQDKEVLGVFDLVGQEQADGLQGLLASVDVIAQEEVVCLRREATVFEQTEEVIVLTVDVTTDLSTRHVSLDASGRGGGPQVGRMHTLMGASSSSKMGWEMKISRALVQR
jgi:hypothetical protein